MATLKSLSFNIFVLAVSFLLGLGYVSSSALAREHSSEHEKSKTTNERELISRVVSVDRGWDWLPRCSNGAYWSIHDERCKGGTGREYNHNERYRNYSRSYSNSRYGTTNAAALVAMVKKVDAGWNWKPRCANGSHWSWNDNRCKGGTGHDDHHHHHR